MANYSDNDDGGGSIFAHLGSILWARRWWIIVPTILGAIVAGAAAVLIPSVYRSSALMLVQSPQLSNAIVGDAGMEVIDRRIARIKERTTSRPDLISLIERHVLYKSERERKPLSEVIDTMRSAIVLQPNATELPGNRADERTVAFRLSFEYSDPNPAQAVAQDLMQRILELDASGNTEQANNRVQFLTEQAKGLEKQISTVQGELAAINQRNGGILSNGVTMLGGSGGSYDIQIAALQRENAMLVNQKDLVKTADTRDPAVVGSEAQLAAARAVFSDSHPDVISARQRLEEAKEFAKSNVKRLPVDTVDQQIAFNNSQIELLRATKARETAQMLSSLSAQSRAPLVQQQIAQLQQQLGGLNEQYQTVSTRLMSARAGVRAEDEQMGERLAVVDPPVVPDAPVWPDRPLIAAIGLGGGLALGLLLALAVEFILRPIRDPDSLAAIVGSPPLGVIPFIEPKRKRQPPASGRNKFFSFPRLWFRSR